jgi:hypothetical protein
MTFFRCWRFTHFNWKCKGKALSLVPTFLKIVSEQLLYTSFLRDAILHQPHTLSLQPHNKLNYYDRLYTDSCGNELYKRQFTSVVSW